MSDSTTLLSELSKKISNNASAIEKYLAEKGEPSPSFDVNTRARFPDDPELQVPRLQLLEAAMDIFNLVCGPEEYLTRQSFCVSPGINNFLLQILISTRLKHDDMVLDVMNQFNFWDAVPLNGSATYAEISSKTGLTENMVRRILRHAMTLHIFSETEHGSGEVIHTPNSIFPVENPKIRSWIGHNLEDVAPACPLLPDVLRKYGETPEAGESPSMQFFKPNSPKNMNLFDFFAIDGEGTKKGWRMRRFGDAMGWISSQGSGKSAPLIAAFDWDSLGEATIVDVRVEMIFHEIQTLLTRLQVGGGSGHDSIAIAKAHPNIRCIVQDFEHLDSQFQDLCPQELKSRVSFQAHNFWEEQPVKGADVYLFKRVLHDYSDKYASKILENVLPAMKLGSRVLVLDQVKPPRGAIPWYLERTLSSLDLQMLVSLSSKERTVEEWIALFKAVDPRFGLKSVVKPEQSSTSVMEFTFH